jgi:hypothetical protein
VRTELDGLAVHGEREEQLRELLQSLQVLSLVRAILQALHAAPNPPTHIHSRTRLSKLCVIRRRI